MVYLKASQSSPAKLPKAYLQHRVRHQLPLLQPCSLDSGHSYFALHLAQALQSPGEAMEAPPLGVRLCPPEWCPLSSSPFLRCYSPLLMTRLPSDFAAACWQLWLSWSPVVEWGAGSFSDCQKDALCFWISSSREPFLASSCLWQLCQLSHHVPDLASCHRWPLYLPAFA